MKSFCFSIVCSVILLNTIKLSAGEMPTAPPLHTASRLSPVILNSGPLDEAESLMQMQKYAAAVTKLDDATLKNAADPAYARYLRALAKHRAKQDEAALADCDAVPENSAWHWKAVFLKAECLTELHRHQEAETIYSAEAGRLFATTRKEKLAGVLSLFAAELLKGPLPGEPPLQQNRTKALELYRKALDIETGAALREDLLYRQAVVLRDLDRVKEVESVCLEYLREYDQDWTGPLGSIQRSRGEKNPKAIAGGHRLELRMMLAENSLLLRNRLAARQYAQDLLDLWKQKPPQPESKPDAGDVEWLLCRSHGALNYKQDQAQAQQRQGGNSNHSQQINASPAIDQGDPVQRTESLRAFLKNYSQHSRAAEAATSLAIAVAAQGKTEESITAFESFLKTTWPAPALDKSNGDRRPASERLADWQQEAFYIIGTLRFDLKQYDKAIAQWRGYTAMYPNGRLWQQAQSRIVDAEFQLCLEPVAASDEAAARKHFDEFIAKHPLDTRAAQLMFLAGQFPYAKAQELEKKKSPAAESRALYETAIAEWSKLISKYPLSEEASLAMYRTGVLQTGPLERYEEGLATFKKLTWGGWKQLAQERATMLPQKSLALSTERVFRSNEKPTVHVNVRNIEKLKVSVYKLSLEDFFRSRHRLDGEAGIESLDIDLIQPDKTWEVPVAAFTRLKPIEQEIEVPFDEAQPGVKVVRIEGDDWQASTVVIRSDVDFIIESAWKEGLVFAVNRLTNKPVAGAEVLISDGKKIIGQGKTAADGVFRLKGEMIREAADLCVHLRSQQGEAVHRLNLRGMTQEIIEGIPSDERIVTLAGRGYIYTDRSAYRAGETVHFRAIIRDVKDGAYTVPEGRAYKVKVLSPDGRVLRESNEKLSAFGTFTADVQLPNGSPLGEYSIVAVAEDGIEKHRGSFEVADFKLPDVQLEVEIKPQILFRGDTINGIVRARHYFGSAVKDEIVRVHMPDGRLLEGRTDAEGKFAFTQETSGFQPGAWLTFKALLPSKNINASATSLLQTTGIKLAWERIPETVVAGEASALRVKATSPDGKPLATSAKLTISRQDKTAANSVLAGLPGINYLAASKQPVKITEIEIKTDEKTGIATVPFTIAAGGDHLLVVEAKDSRGNPATISGRTFSSSIDDSVKIRLFADETTVDEGAAINVRAHSRIDAPLALVTIAGEDIIEHRIIALKNGHTPLGVNIAPAHWPRFDVTVAFLDGQKLHRARESFAVKRELKLAITPPAETMEPGSEAEIKLSATDQQGHPVKAELSLALVNDALFAEHPDNSENIATFFQRGARPGSSYRFDSSAAFTHRAHSRQVQSAAEGASSHSVAAVNHVERVRVLESLEAQVYQEMTASSVTTRSGQRVNTSVVREFIYPTEFNAPQIPTTIGATGSNVTDSNGASGGEGERLQQGRLYESIDELGRRNRMYYWNDDESTKLNIDTSSEASYWDKFQSNRLTHEGAQDSYNTQWHCPITTDAAGSASVKLKLPAQHGSWRLGAKGCTVSTLVGDAEKHIVTRRNFFIELRQPVALREGDVWRPEVVVHALDGAERELKIAATMELPDGAKKFEKSLRVKPGQSASVYFDAITVPREVEMIRWSAECMDAAVKATASTVAAVLPWSITQTVNSGIMGDGTVKIPLTLPDAAKPDAQRNTVMLHLTASALLNDMVAMGSSQTAASSLLSTVSALRVAKASKAPVAQMAVLEARIRELIAELQITQRDGGWSWQGVNWQHDTIVTGLGLWGLREAATLGFNVNDNTFKSGVKYLKSALAIIPPGEPEKAAAILHALALEHEADFSVANRMYRDRDSLNDPALAYLAGAFVRMQRNEEAKELLDLLAKKTGRGNAGAFQCRGSAIVARLSNDDDTAAIILWSLAKGNPKSPIAKSAMEQLLRAGGAQLGAQSSVQGLWTVALAEHFLAQPEVLTAAAFEGEVFVNGKSWRKISGADSQQQPAFVIPKDLLKGAAEASIELRGARPHAFVHSTVMGLQNMPAILHLKSDTTNVVTQPGGKNINLPSIKRRAYLHDILRHHDVPLNATSSSPVSTATHGQLVRVAVDIKNPEDMRQSYFALDETVPAGCSVVEGSVQSNHVKMEPTAFGFRLWFKPGTIENVRYLLVAQRPGTWVAPSNVLRDACDARYTRSGSDAKMTILSPGETATDNYEMNRAERFELAGRFFDENDFANARIHLDALQADAVAKKLYERDIARMLLWIHTSQPQMDARLVVDLFETLSERHADLVIPFDKILRVATAYRQIGEFERAWLVDRATIESSFVRDSRVSVALRDAGDFLGAADHQLSLWSEYPDVHDVLLAFFSLAQDFQDKAADVASIPVRDGTVKPTNATMLGRSRDLLRRYVTLYANDEAADGAAFNLSNVFFDLKDYAKVAIQAESAAGTYPKSPFLTSFQYMTALGHFWQYEFPQALAAAAPVATGNSKDAPNARYITAQIHHAQGHPQEAIDWYKKVRDEFPDAGESITYLEEKRVMLPPASSFKPGQPVKIELSSRNVKEAALKIYKVDLLKLHDRSSNLSDVTKVSLAGITPEAEIKVALGGGRDFAWKKQMLELPVKKEGAYLVICRGDDLFTSALVIVTPMELEVREDNEEGGVRVYVKDGAKGSYVADAEIEIIDSAGASPTTGRTDPRGAFQASGVSGYATIVVKHGDTRYAYHRSAMMLQPSLARQRRQDNTATPASDPFSPNTNANPNASNMPQQMPAKPMSKKDYFSNVKKQLEGNAADNKAEWNEKMSKGGKGVEVQKAMKK